MLRLLEAFLLALGLSWGLVPHTPSVATTAAPGFGADRAYLEAGAGGQWPPAGAPAAALLPRPRSRAAATAWRVGVKPPERASRRRFLQLMRLQLEGG